MVRNAEANGTIIPLKIDHVCVGVGDPGGGRGCIYNKE